MSSGSKGAGQDAGQDDGNADSRPPFAGESTADALIEHRVSGEQVFAGALLDVRRDRLFARAWAAVFAGIQAKEHMLFVIRFVGLITHRDSIRMAFYAERR